MIKKRICINLFAIFLLNFFSTHAQNTEGTEFWLTFGKNLDRPPSGIQISIICGEHPTTGTIYFTNLGTSVNFNIEARSAYFYKLNDAEMEAALNMTTGITNYSVHITSNKPVTVYAMNRAIYSTDATNVLPVTALGTDYYQISYTPYDWYGWLFPDAYAVVGTKNNTKLYHNGVLAATLNKGQVYYRASGTDMTGARITADNPVAFFAVHQGVQIPVGWESGECLMQQLAPVNTWGKNYFVPVSHRQRDIVRIVASQNNTNITQAGGTLLNPMGGQASLTNLQAGQFVELEISLNNNGCYIQADKPIGVCTYLTGQEYSVGSAYSDPAQCWVPSVEQTVTEALIIPSFRQTNIFDDYVLVITPTASKEDTKVSINGAPPTALSGGGWRDNTAAGMSFYTMPLTTYSFFTYHFTNQEGLIILCYGTDYCESYYILAASAMHKINAAFFANDIYYQDLPFEPLCTDEIIFRAEIDGLSLDPGSLRWYIDGIEEITAQNKLSWSKNFSIGEYDIKMFVRFIGGDTLTIGSTLSIGAQISTASLPAEGGNTVGEGCYKIGTPVNLSATPNTTYYFVNWTEDGIEVSTNDSYTFTVTESRNLVANFKKISFSIHVDVNNSEYGYATGMGIYEINTDVRLEAFVNDCYRFANWTIDGTEVSTDNPYVFIATENVNLIANFYVLDFDTYATMICDNIFLLNLRKLSEDGYEVTGCKWFKNGIEENDTRTINEFSYSAGVNELLELTPTYYMFRLSTDNHGNLCSSNKVITSRDKSFRCSVAGSTDNLFAYPNPVLSGSSLTIEGVIKDSPIYVYNHLGACVHSTIATDEIITLTLNFPQGIYLIRANDKIVKIMMMK